MADKEEEVLPQGMVMDGDAVRPITREEAEHGLHDSHDEPKREDKPAAAPPRPPAAAVPPKPAEKPEDQPGHAGPPRP